MTPNFNVRVLLVYIFSVEDRSKLFDGNGGLKSLEATIILIFSSFQTVKNFKR